MIRLEFHPGDGGTDAALFARQLADAVGAYAAAPVFPAGRGFALHRL